MNTVKLKSLLNGGFELRDSHKIFLSNILYNASFFLLGILIVKIFKLKAYDDFSFALAIVSPIMLFFNFNLRSYILSSSHKGNEFDFGGTLAFRIVFSLLPMVICIAATFFVKTVEMKLFLGVTLLKMSDHFFEYLNAAEQFSGKFTLIIRSQAMRSVLHVLIVPLSYFLFGFDNGFLIISSVILVISFVLILMRIKSFTNERMIQFDFKMIFELAKKLSPFLIIGLIDNLIFNFPKYLIKNDTNHYVGIFSALTLLSNIGFVLIGSQGQYYLREISLAFSRDDNKTYLKHVIKRYFLFVNRFSLLFVVVFSLGSSLLLKILYGPEIAAYSLYFIYILIASGCWYISSVYLYILLALQSYKDQLFIYILTFIFLIVCNVVLNYFFNPLLGAVVSFSVTLIFRLVILFFYFKVKMWKRIYS